MNIQDKSDKVKQSGRLNLFHFRVSLIQFTLNPPLFPQMKESFTDRGRFSLSTIYFQTYSHIDQIFTTELLNLLEVLPRMFVVF